MAAEPVDEFALTNLLRPEILADPYPFYHRLRAADPVRWDEEREGWVLTRHADVVAALRDPRLGAERVEISLDWMPEEAREPLAPAWRAFRRQMLFLDPPDHTRLRGLVNKAFTPRVVEAMRARVQQIADELLDAVVPAGAMDLIRDLAFPLPVFVIAEMLGVPAADRERFTRWTGDLGTLIDGSYTSLEEVMGALRGLTELMDYFRAIMAEHRARPRQDLLQALLEAEDRGDVLSEDELLGNCMLLLAAGHGTTTHLIGNGTLALLRHPDQLRRLRDEPGQVASAVMEMLRYDGPVQLTGRRAKEPLEIAGRPIAADQDVIMVLGAANHDPAQFPDPDRLDIGRAELRHVAFGHGIHYCVGAPLAQLEGQVVFPTLLRRLPDLRLAAATVEHEPSVVFRGLRSLPVAFG